MNNERMYDEINRLRRELDDLGSKFVAMKRHYEDLLNNLDEDNFSANYRVQQGNKFSEISQTAQKISATVSDLSDDIDGVAGNISNVELKADRISSAVTKIYGKAEYITSKNDMTDKEKLYFLNGQYYYYNDVSLKWLSIDTGSIVSQIIQTSDGFILKGTVKISGDQIVDGVAFLRNDVNIGDASTLEEQKIITFNSVAKISTIKGADLYPDEYAGIGISAPLLKLGSRVDFSDATVTGLYAVFE